MAAGRGHLARSRNGNAPPQDLQRTLSGYSGAVGIATNGNTGSDVISGVNTAAGLDPADWAGSWQKTGTPSTATISPTFAASSNNLDVSGIGGAGDFAKNQYIYAPHMGVACSEQGIGSCPAPAGVALYIGAVETVALGATPTNIVVGHPQATAEAQSPASAPNGSVLTFTGTTAHGNIDVGTFFLTITPPSGSGSLTVYAESSSTALVGYPGVRGSINLTTGAWSVTLPSGMAPPTGSAITASYAYSGAGNAAAVIYVRDHYDQEQYQLVSSLTVGIYGLYTATDNGDATYTLAFNPQNTDWLIDIYYVQSTPPAGSKSICAQVAGVDGPLYGISLATTPVCLNGVDYTLPTMTAPIFVKWNADNYYSHLVYESFNGGAYKWMGQTYAGDTGPAGQHGNIASSYNLASIKDVSDFQPNAWVEWGGNTWSAWDVPTTPPSVTQNRDYYARITSVSSTTIVTDTNAGVPGNGRLYHNDGPAIRNALFSSGCTSGGCAVQLPDGNINVDFITMPRTNVHIRGNANDATTLKAFGDGGGPVAIGLDWQANTTYAQATKIQPKTNNPQLMAFVSNFSAACTTAGSAPDNWPQTLGATVSSGTCSFTNVGSNAVLDILALRFYADNLTVQTQSSGAGAIAAIEQGQVGSTQIFSAAWLAQSVTLRAPSTHATRSTGLWTHFFEGYVGAGVTYPYIPLLDYGDSNAVTWAPWDLFTSWPGKFLECTFCYTGSVNQTIQNPAAFENSWNMIRPVGASGSFFVEGMEIQNVYVADIAPVTMSNGSGGTSPAPRGVEVVANGENWHVHSAWWFWSPQHSQLNGVWQQARTSNSSLEADQIRIYGDKFGLMTTGHAPLVVNAAAVSINDGGVGIAAAPGSARYPIIAPSNGSSVFTTGLATGYSPSYRTCMTVSSQDVAYATGSVITTVPDASCSTTATRKLSDVSGETVYNAQIQTQNSADPNAREVMKPGIGIQVGNGTGAPSTVIDESQNLTVASAKDTGLAGAGSRCLRTDASGNISASASDCATSPPNILQNAPAWARQVGDGSDGAGPASGAVSGVKYYGIWHCTGAITYSGGPLIVFATGAVNLDAGCSITQTSGNTGGGDIGGAGGSGGSAAADSSASKATAPYNVTQAAPNAYVVSAAAAASSGGAGNAGGAITANTIREIIAAGPFMTAGPRGGGVGTPGGSNGGSAGSGGYPVIIISGASITLASGVAINTSGFQGGDAAGNSTGGGGGGGAGPIILSAPTITDNGAIYKYGGGPGGNCTAPSIGATGGGCNSSTCGTGAVLTVTGLTSGGLDASKTTIADGGRGYQAAPDCIINGGSSGLTGAACHFTLSGNSIASVVIDAPGNGGAFSNFSTCYVGGYGANGWMKELTVQ